MISDVLIEDSEGRVYGKVVCVYVIEGYDFQEEEFFFCKEYDTKTKLYTLVPELSLGWSSDSKKVPHDVLVQNFIYSQDYNEASFVSAQRDKKINDLLKDD